MQDNNLFQLPEPNKINENELEKYETASFSKALFSHCIQNVPHCFLEATKKHWREMFKKRNQNN